MTPDFRREAESFWKRSVNYEPKKQPSQKMRLPNPKRNQIWATKSLKCWPLGLTREGQGIGWGPKCPSVTNWTFSLSTTLTDIVEYERCMTPGPVAPLGHTVSWIPPPLPFKPVLDAVSYIWPWCITVVLLMVHSPVLKALEVMEPGYFSEIVSNYYERTSTTLWDFLSSVAVCWHNYFRWSVQFESVVLTSEASTSTIQSLL